MLWATPRVPVLASRPYACIRAYGIDTERRDILCLQRWRFDCWGIHPTSASTERNWSLWGRVYMVARNALGLERAKALITVCFNDRCQVTDQRDFKLLLSVVENEFVDEEQVSGHGEDGNVDTAGTSATARDSSDDLDVGVSVNPILDRSFFEVLVMVLETRNEKGRCSHALSLYGKQCLFMHATAAIFDVQYLTK
jgi:hypothetical protein